jgi:hypothetical protein
MNLNRSAALFSALLCRAKKRRAHKTNIDGNTEGRFYMLILGSHPYKYKYKYKYKWVFTLNKEGGV